MTIRGQTEQSAEASVLSGSQSERLCGEVRAPGDKSVSHRALIIGALAKGRTEIRGLLESADVLSTVGALRALGAGVREEGGRWTIRGRGWQRPDGPIDCGNSGTTARLLLGAIAPEPIDVTFTGDESLRGRPMDRVLAPLVRMGLKVSPPMARSLPVEVRGGSLHGITHRNRFASAQVKSAILLAGLRAKGVVEVIEPDPSRDHTERMLRHFGCEIGHRRHEGHALVCLGSRRELQGREIRIPGDPSSAAFPLVAALITPGSAVTVRDMMINPLRLGFLRTLGEMGAIIDVRNHGALGAELIADVTARHSPLQCVRVPAVRAPSMIDEYPIVAVAAAFASGTSLFEGIAELRHKESDRLDSIVRGLTACGVRCRVSGNDLLVEGTGGKVRGGAGIRSAGDHRIAMAFLVLGLGSTRAVEVDGAGMIATSFPGFAPLMRSLGAAIG